MPTPATPPDDSSPDPLKAAQTSALLAAVDEHAIVAVTDRKGVIVHANDAFCEISGYRREEILGKTHSLVNSAVHDKDFWKDFWSTIGGGKTWQGEICNRKKTGELYWLKSTIQPVRDSAGDVLGYIALRTDITEQKRKELALLRSNEQLNEASRVSRIGSWEFDAMTGCLEWSWMTKQIHEVEPDYEPNIEAGIKFYEAGWSRDRIDELVRRCLETGESWDEELKIVTARGAVRWVRAIGNAEFKDGGLVRMYGVFQDIDESKRHRLASERNEALLRSVVDAATEVSIVATDTEGTITMFNRGAELLLGYEAEELVGKCSPAVFHKAEEVEARAAELSQDLGRQIGGFETFVTIARAEGSERREWTYVNKNGGEFLASLGVTPMRDRKGEITGYLGIAFDLTARERAAAALLESESRFRGAFESTGIGMAIVGLDGRWLRVNQALREMLGYPEGAMERLTFRDVVHPEDADADAGFFEETLSGRRQGYGVEKRYFDSQKRILWVSINMSLVRTGSGEPLHFISQIEDVTERRTYSAQLAAAKSRLELAAKVGGVGIWDFDLLTGKLEWDDQMFVLYGQSREVFKGVVDDWTRCVHPDDVDQASAAVGAAIAGEAEFNTKFRVIWPNGSVRHLHGIASVERDAEGQAQRMVGTNIDITDSVRHSERLQKLATEAQAASEAKSQFLANMSHEIRTPINGVIGMTRLLLDAEGLDDAQMTQVRTIYSSAQSLLNLINDILDFSKVEAGKMELQLEPFSLREILGGLRDMFDHEADGKGIELICEADAETPDCLVGDPSRLRQILVNLMGNSFKFTERGSISLNVSMLGKTPEAAKLRFALRDTGIGISEENQKQLFEEFNQADSSMSRRFGGTGLGLSICRGLTELMGGEIGLESEEGSGSEFWAEIEFPYEEKEYKEVVRDTRPKMTNDAFKIHAATALKNRASHALIAEDNEVNQMVARGILTKFGIATDVVENGVAAIDALSRKQYDFVLMDVQMPILDGHEASRKIRSGAAGETSKTVPIIALTAHARREDREACIDAQMDAYISKPFTPEGLLDVLLETLPEKDGMAPAPEVSDDMRPQEESLPVFDRERFISGMMDDETLAAEIAALSLVDLQKRSDDLDTIAAEGDGVAFGKMAHAIKGVAGHSCLDQLRELAAEMEDLSRDGRVAEAKQHVAVLRVQLDEGMAALQEFAKSQ